MSRRFCKRRQKKKGVEEEEEEKTQCLTRAIPVSLLLNRGRRSLTRARNTFLELHL